MVKSILLKGDKEFMKMLWKGKQKHELESGENINWEEYIKMLFTRAK